VHAPGSATRRLECTRQAGRRLARKRLWLRSKSLSRAMGRTRERIFGQSPRHFRHHAMSTRSVLVAKRGPGTLKKWCRGNEEILATTGGHHPLLAQTIHATTVCGSCWSRIRTTRRSGNAFHSLFLSFDERQMTTWQPSAPLGEATGDSPAETNQSLSSPMRGHEPGTSLGGVDRHVERLSGYGE
jgi:hypothetical protein